MPGSTTRSWGASLPRIRPCKIPAMARPTIATAMPGTTPCAMSIRPGMMTFVLFVLIIMAIMEVAIPAVADPTRAMVILMARGAILVVLLLLIIIMEHQPRFLRGTHRQFHRTPIIFLWARPIVFLLGLVLLSGIFSASMQTLIIILIRIWQAKYWDLGLIFMRLPSSCLPKQRKRY